jgi:RNA polymerase sigma-70 factor (ECF subfamily)
VPREDNRYHAEAFETFYRREYRQVVSLARALLPTDLAAEDLAQEAFIKAHQHWDRVGAYDRPIAWVRRVLINRATSLRRRLGAEWRAVDRLGSMTNDAVEQDLSPETREVWAAVRRLPRRQAQAVALHYVGGLTLDEIGEALGCSTGTVKSHLHRARTRLSETLSTWSEETR